MGKERNARECLDDPLDLRGMARTRSGAICREEPALLHARYSAILGAGQMSPKDAIRFCKTVALAFVMFATASEALGQYLVAPPPPYRTHRSTPSYAGDCGPNPPPGYRWDLKDWRSGFNRDFYCYMLDEY
jgi:hypothetical protein